MESNLQSCIEYLDSIGADVFDVGCRWQDTGPMTLAEKSDAVTGILLMGAQLLLLWALAELARSHFGKWKG